MWDDNFYNCTSFSDSFSSSCFDTFGSSCFDGGPSFNIDGTPMIGMVDTQGRPWGMI